ncbi:hypothetical protein BK120_00090 [Paenibacillus sp. FSL A5-0031]|uniref:S-layer homology domain-containing protein n=1 Tax=Paenibacillus sp. FSL A5-0031 TaxID=1920420 RepID=UPI00096F37C6|nr:S-layer homology domain-containing protein [Paenibacillus sp. FSL A5-0031]OME87774.1 hypothetical protein BK120_00090 [Paenibacillus sp. FSL A5-0031]
MLKKIVFQLMMCTVLLFTFAMVSFAAEIVIDNGDPGYSETGTWVNSNVSGYKGTPTRYSNVGERTVKWTPTITEAGEYEVFIFKIANSTASDKDVDIEIVYEGGTISTEQDWTTGSSGWVSLGKYPFAAGTSGYVMINGELSGTATYTRADAVKFVYDTPPILEPINYAPVGVYYVDSIDGNDSNNGTNESSAWKTLDKVNSFTYQPGSKILLKSGSYWIGQLKPKGSGSDGNPIIIDIYGSGNKPIIDGNGITNTGVVHLYNQQYWEINNLEIMNDALDVATRFGIYIELSDYGTANHIYVKDCYVHNIKGDNSHPHKGVGIFYFVSSTDTSKFNDILIENNTIKTVDRSGIILRNPNDTFSTGVVIRNNFVEDIGGDGIVAKTSKAPLMEYNIAKDTSARANSANAAIWTWYTDDAIVQYNESYNTVRLPNNLDANGFDSDFNNNRSIFQYNYSHDNGGGFILIIDSGAASFNDGTIIRYNISQNDKEKVINLLGDITNTQFYNNTFYLDSTSTAKMIEVRNFFGIPKTTSFYNNIFYNLGSGGFDLRKVESFLFDTNIFYGAAAPVSTVDADVAVVHSIAVDPKLVAPGSGGANIDFNAPTRLSGYMLQSDSPAINAGLVIENNGGKDFWGNPLYQGKPDIGAYEATIVPVQTIDLIGASTLIDTKGGSLQLHAEVLPANASNKDVTWSVYEVDGTATGKATIDVNGLLTALKDGKVKVVATATDGSAVMGTKAFTITGQNETGNPDPGTNPGANSGTVVNDKPSQYVLNENEIRIDPAQNGQTAVTVVINEKRLVQQLEDLQKTEHKPILQIVLPGKHSLNAIELPLSALYNRKEENKETVLRIQSHLGSYDLPLSILSLDGIESAARLDGVKLIIRMNRGTTKDGEQFGEFITERGLNRIGDLIDYKLIIKTKDKEEELRSLGRIFVKRVMNIDHVIQDTSSATAVVINPNTGVLEFVPSLFKVKNGMTEVTIVHNTNSLYGVVQNKITFEDMIGHWAKKEVEALASKMIIKGTTDRTFTPNNKVTRAQFAALIVRGLGLSTENVTNVFTDVSAASWYALEVNTAAKFGLVQGVGNGTFNPEQLITREQMVVMIMNAVSLIQGTSMMGNTTNNPFADQEQVSSYAHQAVVDAVNNGLITGKTATTFAPQDAATRAQAAVIINRALQYLNLINL